MISLHSLRVFNAVVEQKSVVLAAEKLFISQPAVSVSLKKLQDEIHVRLFHKSGRNLVVTEQGNMLYSLTKKLFGVEKEIEELVSKLNSQESQSIHVGLVTLYERFGSEEILHKFSGLDKNLSVVVHSGNSAAIMEMLGRNTLDIGIVGNITGDINLVTTHYRQHEIFLVAPKGHRLFGKKNFLASDIHNERVVLKELGSSVRNTVDNFLQRYEVKTIPVMELSNIDAILSLVETEQCITFLPDLSVAALPNEKFSKARFQPEKLSFPIYIATYKPEHYTVAKWQIVKSFLEQAGRV